MIGIIFFKEKGSLGKWLSLALVGAGLCVYVYPFSFSSITTGCVFAMLSGLFDTLANSFRKYLSGKVDRFVLVVLQMIGGLILAVALMLVFGQTSMPSLSSFAWLVGAIFGVCLVAISYLTLIGFQYFELNLGEVVLSSELFFATVLAFVFFGETATVTEIAGGLLILTATALAHWTPAPSVSDKMSSTAQSN